MIRHSVGREDLEPQRMDEYEGCHATLGELNVGFESMPAGFPEDPAAVFAGLPDDHCQCPHWGYLLRGSFRVHLVDGTEFVVRAGEAYHLPPGHLMQTIEAVEIVEFSPKDAFARTMEQVGRNIERLQAAAG